MCCSTVSLELIWLLKNLRVKKKKLVNPFLRCPFARTSHTPLAVVFWQTVINWLFDRLCTMRFKVWFSCLVYKVRMFVLIGFWSLPLTRLQRSFALSKVSVLNLHNIESLLSNLFTCPYYGPITCESQHLPWWNSLKLESKTNVDLDYWQVKVITCKVMNNV